MASSQGSATNPPNFFKRNEDLSSKNNQFQPAIIRKAQTARNLVSSTPHTALSRIQVLCQKHRDNGLLFRTQAEILEKCSDIVTDLDKKKTLMGEAIKCARKSIALSPNSINFSSFLAYLLYKSAEEPHHYKTAIQQFNQSLYISNPSDPAQETLLTDEEIQSMSPTYEARIEDARKCILKYIGECVLMLKKLKAYSVIQECLQTVEVNNNEERLHLAWYSLNLSEKRLLLEEHLEGTVRNVAIKIYDAATTGTKEVVCSVKIKEPTDKLPLPGEHDVDGTTLDNLGEAAQIEAEVPDVEVLGEPDQIEAEEIEFDNFVEFAQSGDNLVILTGQGNLSPKCYNNYICQMWQNMSRVLQNGPMALILMSEENLDQAISPFPETCRAVVLRSSVDMIGSDVIATTLSQLGSYLALDLDDNELDDVRLVVINTVDGVLFGFPDELRENVFKHLKAKQVVLINSVYNAEVQNLTQMFSGTFKIVDFPNMDVWW